MQMIRSRTLGSARPQLTKNTQARCVDYGSRTKVRVLDDSGKSSQSNKVKLFALADIEFAKLGLVDIAKPFAMSGVVERLQAVLQALSKPVVICLCWNAAERAKYLVAR